MEEWLVLSDSHGDDHTLRSIISLHPQAKTILFLGDGVRDFSKLADVLLGKTVHLLRGNNDYVDLPVTKELFFAGHRLLACHGHTYAVKRGMMGLLLEGRARGCEALLFGHTHIPCNEYQQGMLLLNPGSCNAFAMRRPTYALLLGDVDGLRARILEVTR